MTVPGETDNTPIKVVPIYLDPIVEEEAPVAEAPPSPAAPPAPAKPRRTGLVGGFALLVAIASAVLLGVAVNIASTGSDDAGTTLAWVTIASSALAVLAGLVAAVFRFGRGTGIAAIIIGILVNPWFLVTVLGFLTP